MHAFRKMCLTLKGLLAYTNEGIPTSGKKCIFATWKDVLAFEKKLCTCFWKERRTCLIKDVHDSGRKGLLAPSKEDIPASGKKDTWPLERCTCVWKKMYLPLE